MFNLALLQLLEDRLQISSIHVHLKIQFLFRELPKSNLSDHEPPRIPKEKINFINLRFLNSLIFYL